MTKAAPYLITLTCVLSLSLLAACSDNEDKGCATDFDCSRGQICDDDAKSCVNEPCQSLSDCPGSGRVCLQDTMTCSRRECGDGTLMCPEGLVCNNDGPYLWSCGAPPSVTPDALVITDDAGVDAAMQTPDAGGGDTYRGLCQACTGNRDCAALGDGAACTPIGNTGRFCTSACGPDLPDCPDGFTCLGQLQQCVPVNYDCTVCPGRSCDDGLACDVASGQCVTPRSACESCTGDSSCAEGLSCSTLENGNFCLPSCAGGAQCPADYSCNGETCEPDAGRCDACGGQCGGATPACIAETGMCGECSNDTPCPIGEFCDPMTNTCSGNEPCECGNDAQCATCGGRPICLQGNCVECLDDTDCPARSACNLDTFACEASPCSGVTCQMGSQCSEQTGRCEPGCNVAADCADPNTLDCNPATGQCFYRDGTCDPGAGDGVCAPGATCTLNPLTMTAGCSCKKVNPDDFFSPDVLIGCQPGFVCFQIPMTPEGLCIESPI